MTGDARLTAHGSAGPEASVVGFGVAGAVIDAVAVVLVAGGEQDGDKIPATKAQLKTPFGVAFYHAGNLYFV